MAIHQIMLKTKVKFLTLTSLVFFVLLGVSNSIPLDQPAAADQNADSEGPLYIPEGNLRIL